MARLFVILLWNIFVIGGCAYVVFWKDASGWWFLLAVLMLDDFPSYEEQEDDEEMAPPPPPAKPINPPRSR